MRDCSAESSDLSDPKKRLKYFFLMDECIIRIWLAAYLEIVVPKYLPMCQSLIAVWLATYLLNSLTNQYSQ